MFLPITGHEISFTAEFVQDDGCREFKARIQVGNDAPGMTRYAELIIRQQQWNLDRWKILNEYVGRRGTSPLARRTGPIGYQQHCLAKGLSRKEAMERAAEFLTEAIGVEPGGRLLLRGSS